MTTETAAPSTQTPAPVPDSFGSAEDAARFWISQSPREEESEAAASETEPELTAESADDPATAETELSEEDNAAHPEEDATGETEADDPADQQPPLEMPRSWTKAQAEHWKALPRPTQEYLIEQASQASAEVRRVQNETAEKLKGLTVKEQAAEQARQTYENQAKAALNVLMREQQRDYPDIKTMDDVRNLAANDPLRYLQWQAHQQDLQVQAAAVREAEDRSAKATQTRLAAYTEEQTVLLKQMIPEFADAKVLAEARERALPLLEKEYGLAPQQLSELAATEVGFKFLQSAGFQKLVADIMKHRDGDAAREKAVKATMTKPVPPVQRPGVRQPSGGNAERVQSLANRFNNSGDVDDAVALLVARRAGRR